MKQLKKILADFIEIITKKIINLTEAIDDKNRKIKKWKQKVN